MEKIIKDEVYIYYGGGEYAYSAECHDGFAIAKCIDDEAPRNMVLRLEYPKLTDVLSDYDMSSEVLEYNGLFDLGPSDLNFGDVMMCYGEVTKEIYENN